MRYEHFILITISGLANTERVVGNTALSVTGNTVTEFAFLAEECLFVGVPIESDTKTGDLFN